MWAVKREGNVVVTCLELALSDVPSRKGGVGNVRTAEPQGHLQNKHLQPTNPHRSYGLQNQQPKLEMNLN